MANHPRMPTNSRIAFHSSIRAFVALFVDGFSNLKGKFALESRQLRLGIFALRFSVFAVEASIKTRQPLKVTVSFWRAAASYLI